MNREILFKAKTCNGEWVEGYYVYVDYLDKHYIVANCKEHNGIYGMLSMKDYEVKPDTLCQFTGLTDKHGNKIWENDIVFVTDDEDNSGMVDTGIGEIDFLKGLWYISGYVQNSLYDINECYQIEVIGNIFDNADLLGKDRRWKD